jgi:hypothetical protein
MVSRWGPVLSFLNPGGSSAPILERGREPRLPGTNPLPHKTPHAVWITPSLRRRHMFAKRMFSHLGRYLGQEFVNRCK